jgi:DnaJ-class molecular chaperone
MTDWKFETCPDCEGDGEIMVTRLIPSGHSEEFVTCKTCEGDGIIQKQKEVEG